METTITQDNLEQYFESQGWTKIKLPPLPSTEESYKRIYGDQITPTDEEVTIKTTHDRIDLIERHIMKTFKVIGRRLNAIEERLGIEPPEYSHESPYGLVKDNHLYMKHGKEPPFPSYL